MRICSGAGCGRTVPDDVRFCDECKPAPPPAADDIREHKPGAGQGPDRDAYAHLYGGPKWKTFTRPAVMRRDPFCKRCDRAVSLIADHIVPAHHAIMQARASRFWPFNPNAGFYFLSNLQGLCAPCHGAKTNEDKTHVGPWPDIVAAERAAPKKKYVF